MTARVASEIDAPHCPPVLSREGLCFVILLLGMARTDLCKHYAIVKVFWPAFEPGRQSTFLFPRLFLEGQKNTTTANSCSFWMKVFQSMYSRTVLQSMLLERSLSKESEVYFRKNMEAAYL